MAGIPGFDGFVQADSYMRQRRADEATMARQQQADQWAQEDRGMEQEAAGLRLEAGRMALDDAKLSRAQRRQMVKLSKAYASQDPAALDAFYNTEIDDGVQLTAPTQRTPDGRFVVNHPAGQIVGTWDELFFGKPGGMGLYHFVNPDAFEGIPAQRAAAAQAERVQGDKLELEALKGQNSARAAGIRADATRYAADQRVTAAGLRTGPNGAPARVQTQVGEDGVLYQYDPMSGGWVPAIVGAPGVRQPPPGLSATGDGWQPGSAPNFGPQPPAPAAGVPLRPRGPAQGDPAMAAVIASQRNVFGGGEQTPEKIADQASTMLEAADLVRQRTAIPQKPARAVQPGAATEAAAPAAGSGAAPVRARNPTTGEVVELRNGQWVKVQ